MAKLPVLLLAFNKPAETLRVLEAIRAHAPERLYIAQDAARPNKPEEADAVGQVRQILQSLDWPGTSITLRLQDRNLGLQPHVQGAISWFFDNEPEGVILEDDTLPSPDFWPYCGEMLDRYRHDRRVFLAGGCNLGLPTSQPYSYFFSTQPMIWGWASWADRWRFYDAEMAATKAAQADGTLPFVIPDDFRRDSDLTRMADMETGKVQSWASRWAFTMLAQNGLCAVPSRNLVVNIGFGLSGATNTMDVAHPYANLKAEPMAFPLRHPPYLIRSKAFEEGFFYPGQHFERYRSLKELTSGLLRKIRQKLTGGN